MLYCIGTIDDVLQVRLGQRRAAAWQKFLKRTGLNQADVIRETIDSKMSAPKTGLPSVAASLCGTIPLPQAPPSNNNVAKAFQS